MLPAVPLELEADAARLQQVVVNLLNNAITFTPPGGEAWLGCTADPTYCIVVVKDTGQGMEPELLPVIFEAFTQAPGARGQAEAKALAAQRPPACRCAARPSSQRSTARACGLKAPLSDSSAK